MVKESSTLDENCSPERNHIPDQRIFAAVTISPFLDGHFRTSGTPFGPVKWRGWYRNLQSTPPLRWPPIGVTPVRWRAHNPRASARVLGTRRVTEVLHRVPGRAESPRAAGDRNRATLSDQ